MKKFMATTALLVTLVYGQNWQPVYELFNPSLADHFYTMNMVEVMQAANDMGYTNHGPKYKWSTTSFVDGVAIYRLWNNSDHFYTTSTIERDNCVIAGYTDEGVVGYISSNSSNGLIAWNRYYHSQWDDHAYPVDQNDIIVLVNAGYYSEGVHGFVMPLTDDELPNEPPNANWTGDLYSEYNYEEISFTWQGSDDSTPLDGLWYYIQLSGEGSFDFWAPNNYLNCWPGIGNHTLTITARDLDDVIDPTPLVHNFTTVGQVPVAPSNLSFSLTNNDYIVLHWESYDDVVIGFTIRRDYDIEIANLPSYAREYEDNSVEPGQTYRYTVVAYSHYGWTESEPIYIQLSVDITIRADRFDFPVGYPDLGDGWYDAQPFGSVLADPVLFHAGNDLNKLSGDFGEPIYAPANGVIVYKNNDAAGWGKCVITHHQAEEGSFFVFPDGSLQTDVYFMFAHLDAIVDYDDIVVNESIVQRGGQIATLGNTGSATGPHLHVECWSNIPDGYPLGYGYYENLPNDKYDAIEFISINRVVGNSYDIFVHTYDNEFVARTSGWDIIPGAQELQWLPLGYNNYLLSADTDQDEIVHWDLDLAFDGNYELLVYVPNRYYTTTSAHYVLHRDGYADMELYVDGLVHSNEWVSLGNFDLVKGETNYLMLYSQTDESPTREVSADAVRLHYLNDLGGALTVDEQDMPEVFSLSSYPNPFNDDIMINFVLSNSQIVNLSVYNILGQQVTTLIDDRIQGGLHQVNWHSENHIGRPLASGVYLIVLRTNSDVQTMKVIYIR